MSLRWEKNPNGWYAQHGGRDVGFIVERGDGSIVYHLTAVDTKWITKGRGEVKSIASAKRALERAWAAWLDAFQLEPKQGADG